MLKNYHQHAKTNINSIDLELYDLLAEYLNVKKSQLLITAGSDLGIKSIYEDSKTLCEESKTNNILLTFQKSLSEIPKWNQESNVRF